MSNSSVKPIIRSIQSARVFEIAYTSAPWLAAIFVLDTLIIGLLKAYYEPLWLDEIMGVLIASRPLGQIVALCKSGADNQPVAYHLVVGEIMRFVHNQAFGVRLPSVIGFAVTSACLYLFVSRRAGRVWGIVAMMLPMLTKGWYYATEGRPYAVMLALGAIAAVCWQSLNLDKSRKVCLAGLAVTLLCALNTHYFAVLLFFPFWIAEGVRTYVRRRIDWPVWLCTSVPLAILAAYVPIIRVAKANSGLPFAAFARPSIWNFAQHFFTPTLVAGLCLALLGFVFLSLRPNLPPFAPARVQWRHFAAEAALVVGFTAVPFFAVLLAKFGTHVFFPRYGIAGLFGFAALLGLSGWLIFGRQAAPGWLVVLLFGGLVLHQQKSMDLSTIREGRTTPARIAILRRLPPAARLGNDPIVPIDLDDYMRFFYYGGTALRSRLYYLADEKLAAQYLRFTFNERMMLGSAPFFGTQVVPYDRFIREHKNFYVFGSLEFSGWLLPALKASGVPLRLVQGGPSDAFGDFYDTCLRSEAP